MRHHVFVLLIGFAIGALGTPDVSAQEASSFQELQALVHLGDEVRVTEVSGVSTAGKVVKLSDSSLRLSGFQRDVSSSRILQIERIKRDPLANGIGIGMLVGLGTGAVLIKSGFRQQQSCRVGFVQLQQSRWGPRQSGRSGSFRAEHVRLHSGFHRHSKAHDQYGSAVRSFHQFLAAAEESGGNLCTGAVVPALTEYCELEQLLPKFGVQGSSLATGT